MRVELVSGDPISNAQAGLFAPQQKSYEGSSKLAAFSTRRRKTEGRISNAVQISNIERREGLVLPRSMRLMNALSYPAFAAKASWLIFCSVRRLRSNSPKTTEGSLFGLFVFDVATSHCGTASILRAAYNSCGGSLRCVYHSSLNVSTRGPASEPRKRFKRLWGSPINSANFSAKARSNSGRVRH